MTRKVGVIDYLNSLPVYLAFEERAVALPPGVEIVKGTPTELNARALTGELAVSPVSSIHYARNWRALSLIPGISIHGRGFVHSVALFYRDELATLDGGTIAVTEESATSEVLLKILLREQYGIDARLVRARPDLEGLGRDYDGALLIGDGALEGALAYPNLGRRDLGLEWLSFAGVPMVFAVWAAPRALAEREPAFVASVSRAFAEARAWGAANRAKVVDAARARSGLPRALLESYFRNLRYDLDAEALEGLGTYFRHAHSIGELADVPPIEVPA